MRSVFAAFLMSLGVSALITPLVRRLALGAGAMDPGGGRKVHQGSIPRLGGIAIVLGFFAPLTALLFLDAGINSVFLDDPLKVLGLYLGGVMIALLGIYDDFRGADARKKFLVQFTVAGLVWLAGFRVELLSNPFGESLELGWLGLPITLVWIAGVINALNLIDGLDGLAGGVAIFVLGTLFILGYMQDRVLVCLLCAALGGATLGFLFYNFNPATIFMGDTGSLFLGFVISTMSILGSQKSSTAVAVAIPLLALGLPLADTALAMFRRILRGRSPFSADREHIHHKLLDLGLSHREAVLTLYGACLFLALCALAMVYLSSADATALLVVVGLVAFGVFRRMGYLSLEGMKRDITIRRTTSAAQRERRDAVRSALSALAEPPLDQGAVLVALRACASAVGFSDVDVELLPSPAPAPPRTSSADLPVLAQADADAPVLCVKSPLDGRAGHYGELTFRFRDGRKELSSEDTIILDLVRDELLDRLENSAKAKVIALKRRAS